MLHLTKLLGKCPQNKALISKLLKFLNRLPEGFKMGPFIIQLPSAIAIKLKADFSFLTSNWAVDPADCCLTSKSQITI